MRRALVCVLVAVGLMLSGGASAALSAAPAEAAVTSDAGHAAVISGAGSSSGSARPFLPVLAYYYMWFDPSSWDRAKTDYPVLGRYSSDDIEVTRKHVRIAKAAGINGFIVSWKSTDVNNRRLRQLVDVARSEDFGLSVIYQGLDFDRNPLPIDRIAGDLRFFRDQFAGDPVFHLFDRPLLIWSGTWQFSREDIQAAAAPIRGDVQVLASEKAVEGYARVADVVDGNAYYWSSVDPTQDRGFAGRLREMGEAVHSRGGRWIAPFAPGFDARLVGGSRAVDRRDGATLREEYSAAVSSSPDALGLISWIEFSENTHVDPSQAFGNRYLDVLSELEASPAAAAGELAQDSSGGGAGAAPGGYTKLLLAIGAVLVVVGVGVVLVRRRVRRRQPTQVRHRKHVWPRWGRRTQSAVVVVVVATIGAALLALRTPDAAPGAQSAGQPSQHYQGSKPVRDPGRVVVAAAGDIACSADATGLGDEERNSPTSCVMQATADLVGGIQPDAVLPLGDNQYPNGSLDRFRAGYDHSWGAYKAISYPVPGNHEYGTRDAKGYFDYFAAAAGSPSAGYYSYDLGGWHVIALNSECGRVGGCGPGSDQERWLLADLAAHPAACTMAYWHRPRYSSGTHGDNTDYAAFWADLQAAGAELVLSSHDHDYERFAPLGPNGVQDPAGIRQFVVGTGGDSFYRLHDRSARSEVGIADQPGVLELILRPDGYDWKFRTPGTAGASKAADAGSASCHAAPTEGTG